MWALLAMTAMGAVLAFILAVASKKFAVETNPKVELVLEALPGANCGGCGYAGCAAYAEAVALKNADPTLCAPGGAEVGLAIARILGVTVDVGKARFVALCGCQKKDVKTVAVYSGIQSCRGASLFGLGGGWLDCRYGCLGYGDCARACPFGAITMGPDRRPVVDEARCAGCRKCSVACSRNLMTASPITRHIHVRCHNRDRGAMANRMCAHACIACKKCEKVCPADAIHAPNYLAEIDYGKCIGCGKCVAVCPHQVLVNLHPAREPEPGATAGNAAPESPEPVGVGAAASPASRQGDGEP
ncbi:MAG: RnfABCDGE type electron transport complex subunit B [Planctomycetota bacterium]|jgi:Na+-translocating ferredoxin:NAD+ oxidoreductase RNF subunit RnfB|nr:RnfABCDGE type electron transport complex subunit B [Planctomycetota bacterium]